MNKKTILLAALGLQGWATTALAQGPAAPGLYYSDYVEEKDREKDPEPRELKLINYFFTRGTFTNQLADPSGLKGVSLGPIGIGQNIGSATRVGDRSEAYYIEQRWIPVLSYSPWFTDDIATFRAQFEVDFMWGQAANQLQHNQGGGFNADQVNIQTKNVNVAIYPTRNPKDVTILLGTQPIYDTIYDPTLTGLSEIVRTGYKLAFIGSDATGLSLFSDRYGIAKASFFPLGVAQPDKAANGDARFAFVYLLTADYAYRVLPTTVVGLSLWRLQDDTKGAAFAYEGLVKSGPSSTGLFPYTGVARLNVEQPVGGVSYLGAHFHHDVNFRRSDFAASGFVMLNFGGFTSANPDTQTLPKVDILGVSGNLELMWNWGKTAADLITLEGMFVSGDSDPSDGKFTSAFTLNNYGLPGAVWFNHKTLILFPFSSTVSNYTGAVTDISNQGFGLVSGIVSAAWDIVPDTLNFKVGAAYAQSAVRPPMTPEGIERGRTIGIELNAELKYSIRYLMTVGLHFAWLDLGNFYDGNPEVTSDPYAAFATFTWYAF